MSFLTACLLLDCPASALNNAGADGSARTDNVIAVKKISTADGTFPYVSAQAVRYWLRSTLEQYHPAWKAAPISREGKIAYTDSNPIDFWDDDLLGYMRAPSKKSDAKTSGASSPLEKDRDITRVSPLRVSTFVSTAPVRITSDFGTMTRQNGDPVPYEHEFYRAHLQGALSLDLRAAGTFFDTERVGFKNLDTFRRDQAKKLNLQEVAILRQTAYRLPIKERQLRINTLLAGLATLHGGAKLTQHYTDVSPAIFIGAVLRHGNNPFQRLFTATRTQPTRFHAEAFKEILTVFKDDLLSPLYIGWVQGFLDEERARIQEALGSLELKIEIKHPVEAIRTIAKDIDSNAAWLD